MGNFDLAYPLIRRAAHARLRGKLRLTTTDRQDWEQEVLIAAWRALPQYDPTKAALRTFLERVIGNRLASLVRGRHRVPVFVGLEDYHSIDLCEAAQVELGRDVRTVVAQLPEPERRLATVLVSCTPAEASQRLGIARSTVYERIRRIRIAFELAGYRRRGRGAG